MSRYPRVAHLEEAVTLGHVRKREHPTLPLDMYTYTQACVYGGHWNETTRLCRGLVVERGTGDVIAWPFPKFHNYAEHLNGSANVGPLPSGPFQVYDKIDGSLGIVFHYGDQWHVATKGSFVSDQAIWGQAWLDRHDTGQLFPHATYLAEITYPENRIVCRYEGAGAMTLLGAYNALGEEVPLATARVDWEAMGAPVVDSYEASSVDAIVRAAQENRHFRWTGAPLTGAMAEGWVVRYTNCGTRVKIKLEDYVRLHGTLTRTNAHTLWEALSSGSNPSEILELVPDEFADWVREKVRSLDTTRNRWEMEAREIFTACVRDTAITTRKDFALHVRESPYRAALFRLFDRKEITSVAWKTVEPKPTDPDYLPPSMRSTEENVETTGLDPVE